MSERFTGTIKSFDTDKGTGFIERQGKDVFFRGSAFRSAVPRPLRLGQTVEFNIDQGPRGPQAVDIIIVK
jgi:CspA family cold shock protein